MRTLWSRYAASCVFVISFTLAILIQGSIWTTHSFPDAMEWAGAAEQFSRADYLEPSDTLYGYPADTILHAARPFLAHGFSPEESLRLSLSLLFSLVIAATITTAYLVFPKNTWWIFTAILLIFDGTVMEGTPPSSLVAILLTWLFLLVLLVEERGRLDFKTGLLLGVVGGLALATRLDISLLVFGCALLYIRIVTKHRFWVPGITAVGTFLALDPGIWHDALGYLSNILLKIETHAAGVNGSTTNLVELASRFPYALLAFFGALVFVIYRKELVPLKRSYLVWCLGTTGAIALLLLTLASRHNPIWFFFPLVFIWELFFPLIAYRVLSKESLWKDVRPFIRDNALPFLAGAYVTAHFAAFTLFLALG